MYEELYAPLPDANAYLERIGLAGAKVEPTAQWLDTLVLQQLLHIPFDDLDVYSLGSYPSLAIGDLFSKIVTRRRGGYCFELNSLFCAFLKALGFDSYVVIVHLTGGRDYVPVPSHCAVVTTIGDRQYFADVGFGGVVPMGCVPMDGTLSHGYAVTDEGMHKLVSKEDGSRVMLFKNMPALPVELIPLNFFTSQKPDSLFRSTPSLNLRYEDGSVSLHGRVFRRTKGGEVTEREVASMDEVRELLVPYFGMIPEETPLREYE